MRHSWKYTKRISGLAIAAILVTASPTPAQNITLDGTLGPAGSLPGPFYFIQQSLGRTVGSNLFHSFGRFNLNANELAFFQSAPAIRNIFSRVTGGSPSTINGLIETQSLNVNLFLINPSGILFGPNAQLNVGSGTRGSFIATTLDAVTWSNGGRFSATNPGGPGSLLTLVGDPSGFLASQRTLPPIIVRGSDLRVYEGQSLLLVGGNVALDNATLKVNPSQGGRIEVAGIAGAGTVGLSVNQNDWRLNLPPTVARADVSLQNGSTIDVLAENRGNISVYARNLNISASTITAGIESFQGSATSQAGDILLNATGAIALTDSSQIGNTVAFLGTGNGGNVIVEANSLTVDRGAILVTGTAGSGNAGNVILNVRNVTRFDGTSNQLGENASAGSAALFSTGKAGDLIINTGSLSVTNGAFLGSLPIFAQGSSGNVTINARDTVVLDGENSLGTPTSLVSSLFLSSGKGGDLTINTGSLFVTNGATLFTATYGLGNAGDININARNSVVFDGTGAINNPSGRNVSTANSSVVQGAEGKGGSINITTGSLSVTNGANLNSSTLGNGNAGDILINARDRVSFDSSNGVQSGAISLVFFGAQGKGGDITVNANSFALNNGAGFISSSFGEGDSGNITVNARSTINLSDGSVLLTTTFGPGNAGKLTLQAGDEITLTNGFISAGAFPFSDIFSTLNRRGITAEQVLAGSPGATRQDLNSLLSLISPERGSAGNIDIDARSLQIDRDSQISTTTTSGNGGNIQLQLRDLLLLRRGSTISTSAGTLELGGSGGNIAITMPRGFIVALPQENSDISANAFTGSGGSVNITAQGIYGIQFRPRPTPLSDITASSEFGFSGTVTLNTPDVDPSRGLAPLLINLVDPTGLIAQTCAPRGEQRVSSFVATGRGGLPPSPIDPLQNENTLADWVTVMKDQATNKTTNRGTNQITSQGTDEVVENAELEKTGLTNGANRPEASATSVPQSSAQIVEAQGWRIDADGGVVLTAEASNPAQPADFWRPLPLCPPPK